VGEDGLRELTEQIRSEHPEDKDLLRALESIRVLEDVEYRFFHACLQLYLAGYLMWPATLADRAVDLTKYTARVRSHRAVQYSRKGQQMLSLRFEGGTCGDVESRS